MYIFTARVTRQISCFDLQLYGRAAVSEVRSHLEQMLALALAGATAIASGSSFNERFASTLRTFERIYPADQLPLRNAASRKDGYWPFVSRKEEPPQVLTYGEFPLPLFTQLVDRACSAAELGDSQESATLCDIGSGTGRLVLWAAATGRWKAVFGVELLSSLHQAALERCTAATTEMSLSATRVEFFEGSFADANLLPWRDIDVAFAYTTAFPSDADGVLVDLTAALTQRLRAGCIVIVTDGLLGDGFDLVDSIEGENEGTGGLSVGYIYRKLSPGESDADIARQLAARLESRVATLEAELAERDHRLEELTAQLDAALSEAEALRSEVEDLRSPPGADGTDDDDFLFDLQEWASSSGYLVSEPTDSSGQASP